MTVTTTCTVTVLPGADTDAAELDQLTAELQAELSRSHAGEVRRAPAPAPDPDAEAAESFALGALVLALAPTVIEQCGVVIAAWLEGRAARSVVMEIDGDRIELTNVSGRRQDELIRAFAQRHTRP
ncbi:hypothetical protein [Actinoplanes sp. N902-109]|uniref:effector-associated constant component EACC1 n=1 Tax=Actinoplanes sp. (strain N902-109) TaxID=649831 RepID=UPI0003294432|nr:hypothetical protein [Actinoplanes sp. N902-109]AGL18211.1 hypothetical protein L083_4701 [Actinoplanes sp. N902-109]